MQKFKRPPKPDDFDATISAARKAIEDYFKSKHRTKPKSPTGVLSSKLKEGKIEFEPKWGAYKTAFAQAQHGKCGYCEMMVIGSQDGDVEHFFPKGEIWQLDNKDPDSWGKERDWSSKVENRRHPVISDQGYWWRAYDWTNYLLSCSVCNQKWKLSFFPVENNPRQLPPLRRAKERPLLLNPFDEKVDFARHLKFSKFGTVEALGGSNYGFETIRTCGLDRESLRRSREEKAEAAHQNIIDLDAAIKARDLEAERRAYRLLYGLGKEERVHSGMVRTIFEQETKMKWTDLVRLANP